MQRYKMVFLAAAVFSLALFISAMAEAGTEKILPGHGSIERMKKNGEYVIQVLQVLKEGEWKEAGTLSFDRFFSERAIDLESGFAVDGSGSAKEKEGNYKIRIIQRGGGAAHIDSILFGNMPPVSLKGLEGQSALIKVSKKDFDVVDSFGKAIEFSFPSGAEDRTLRLTARVEPNTISTTPFQFPLRNLRKPMNENSSFYSYQINSERGTIKLDGMLNEVSQRKPFFREFSRTGTGHPSDFTYGWVMNDDKNLYVSIDFTPDNTMDGDKDYAKVYVKTGQGVKEFRVSVPETRWGQAGFTYTDRVSYEHKVYEFMIPLKELGIKDGEDKKELKLAFAAYGTAGPGDLNPSVAFDSVNNRYLVVYMDSNDGNLYGQLVSSNGYPYGTEIVIADNLSVYGHYNPSVAFDNINQRFLVVWYDYRNFSNYDIYGQLINANGTLYNTASNVNFAISDEATNSQYTPSVAYDNINQRFLVVWEDYRSGINNDIYGQVVNADGTLYGTVSNVNFPVSDETTNWQNEPLVSFDNINQRFLVVWTDSRNSTSDIYGQLINADGTVYNTASNVNFPVSDETTNYQYTPSVTYDNINQRFLVVWYDYRNGYSDIYGQLINAVGAPYGTATNVNFPVSDETTNYQDTPSVTYDNINQRFLVVWNDSRNSTSDIYGQLINADGTVYNTASNVNFPASDEATNYQYNPSVAFDNTNQRFLVVWEDYRNGFAPSIYGQLVNADGTPNRTATTVNFPISYRPEVYVVWSDGSYGNPEILMKNSEDGGATWTFQRLTNNSGISEIPSMSVYANAIRVVWYDNSYGNYEILMKTSYDKGASWTYQRLTNNSGDSTGPSITSGGWAGDYVYVVWQDNSFGNYEVLMKSSTDGGSTWTYQRLTNNSGDSFSPVITVDPNNASNVYVVWSDSSYGNFEVLMKSSTDGGATWTFQRLTNNAEGSLKPSIAVDGSNIYIVWYDYSYGNGEILMKSSADGGATWTFQRLTNNAGSSTLPSIEINGNNLYVVWSDNSYGNNEILMKSSTDGGATWTFNRLTNNTGDSLFPSIAVDGSFIFVVWQDDTSGNNEIYLKSSFDGGATWTLKRLTNNTGLSRFPKVRTGKNSGPPPV